MFVDFVVGWGAKFVGITKGGRVSKSLRTSTIEYRHYQLFILFPICFENNKLMSTAA